MSSRPVFSRGWHSCDSKTQSSVWEVSPGAHGAHIHTTHTHKKQCKEVGVSTGKWGIPVEWFWNLVQMQSMRMTRWVCINALLDWTEQINHCLLFSRTTEFEEPIMQEVAQREHKHVMDFSVLASSVRHFQIGFRLIKQRFSIKWRTVSSVFKWWFSKWSFYTSR